MSGHVPSLEVAHPVDHRHLAERAGASGSVSALASKISALTVVRLLCEIAAVVYCAAAYGTPYGLGALAIVGVVEFLIHKKTATPVQPNVSATPAKPSQPAAAAVPTPQEVELRAFHQYVLRGTPEQIELATRDPDQYAQRPNNRALLQNTVCAAPLPERSEVHYNRRGNELLDWRPSIGPMNCKLRQDWYDFTNPHHFYVNFAHATEFGGAYDTFGCVQEERLFAEFPALPYLKWQTQNGVHPIMPRHERGAQVHPPHAEPCGTIIEGVKRQFDISAVPYGGGFHRATVEQVERAIVKVQNPVPVNIVCLAAVDWRGIPNPRYEMIDLEYHFMAAFLANQCARDLNQKKGRGTAVMHTAPWGCGAFLNSAKMMTAIQYLAAQFTDVDLVFHGVGNPMNPGYTENEIQAVFGEVRRLVGEKKTVRQILAALLEKSRKDPSWAPTPDPMIEHPADDRKQ